MCHIDIDVVSEAFSMRSADSPLYARECKKFRKKNIFLIIRRVTRSHVYDTQIFVYVYDGDYLNAKFRKELIRMSESDKDRVLLITTYHQCQHNSIRIYRINRLFSILDALHDPKHKFSYVSTIGGVVLNRQIERIQLKKNYKDKTHSAFSFFMAMFCQVFRKNGIFNKQFIDAVEYVKDVGTCNYKFRYDVYVDGHVRHTMAYDTILIPRPFDNVRQRYGDRLEEVYKSSIINLDVDCEKERDGGVEAIRVSGPNTPNHVMKAYRELCELRHKHGEFFDSDPLCSSEQIDNEIKDCINNECFSFIQSLLSRWNSSDTTTNYSSTFGGHQSI